jgi:hypothetical protein
MNWMTARVLDSLGRVKRRIPGRQAHLLKKMSFSQYKKPEDDEEALDLTFRRIILYRFRGQESFHTVGITAGELLDKFFSGVHWHIQIGTARLAETPRYSPNLKCVEFVGKSNLDPEFPDWDWRGTDAKDISNLTITVQATFGPGSITRIDGRDIYIREAGLFDSDDQYTCLAYGRFTTALEVGPRDTLQIRWIFIGPLQELDFEDFFAPGELAG